MRGCGFHEWLDPPMCSRAKHIIPGLLKKVNTLESATQFSVTEKSVDQGPSPKNDDSSDVIRLIANEVHKLKLLVMIVLLLICLVLFK